MIFDMSPIPQMMPNMAPKWCPNGPENRSKIDPKSDAKFERISASIFDRFWPVLGPKMGPNWWLYFRGGASWGAFGAPSRRLHRKMTSRRPQSAPKNGKRTPKWPPNVPKVPPERLVFVSFLLCCVLLWLLRFVLVELLFFCCVCSGPADCAKRLE